MSGEACDGPWAPDPARLVQVSRCLCCGRQTPHALCHAHDPACGGVINTRDAVWRGDHLPPESCPDPTCPGWTT